jgi:hypothetical protein
MRDGRRFASLYRDSSCAAGFALLNLPKGKSLGRSKPATSSYAQALNCLMRNKISTTNVSELGYLFHDKSSLHIIAEIYFL